MSSDTKDSLADLFTRGGIYRDVKGTTVREFLGALTNALPPISSITPAKLLEAILEREALMPTGIGNGIALPHPRNPVISNESEQFIALAFPEKSIDWNSLDGQRVDSLLLIVSASAKKHLKTLAEVTFLCRQEHFRHLLRERASMEKFLRYIREAERNW